LAEIIEGDYRKLINRLGVVKRTFMQHTTPQITFLQIRYLKH